MELDPSGRSRLTSLGTAVIIHTASLKSRPNPTQLQENQSLHDLRRFIFFANEGEIRRAQHGDQTVQALCLNLVTNEVITWNTVYMTRALDPLRAGSVSVQEEDLPHLAPTLRAHINPYGKYTFDIEGGMARIGLRPLRESTAVASA